MSEVVVSSLVGVSTARFGGRRAGRKIARGWDDSERSGGRRPDAFEVRSSRLHVVYI